MENFFISKGRDCVIIRGEDDITWAPLVPAIVTYLKELGCRVSIIDVSDFSFPRLKSPPSWVIKKYDLQSANAQTDLIVEPYQIEKIESDPRALTRNIPEKCSVALSVSIESMLVTLFGDSRPSRHKILYPTLKNTAFTKASDLFSQALKRLQTRSSAIVLIPNGRFPYQKAVELAAREAKLEVMYYERGFVPSKGFYLSYHQTQDRSAWQERARAFNQSKAAAYDYSKSKFWLRLRRDPTSTTNEFSRTWRKLESAELKVDLDSVIDVSFFTSSSDEFEVLEGWEGFGWRDQYEAFSKFSKSIKGRKILRIHPNFVNKSFSQARDEMKRILWLLRSDKNITPVWPEDKVNSYSLIENSTRVFVSGSTVGLEASADGKSVWNSMNSIYDEFADVKKFEPCAIYDSSFYEPWKVDGSKSLDIIETMIEADIPFSSRVTMPRWNSSTIPLVVRLLNLFRVGSMTYFMLLVGRSVSIRANRIMISAVKVALGFQGNMYVDVKKLIQ